MRKLNAPNVGAGAGLFIGLASVEPMTLVAAKCKMIATYVTGRG
jgi:hypothetical protein